MGIDFYPRPPRGGRRLVFYRGQQNRIISIHALREEGDAPAPRLRHKVDISIHALREEGDGRGFDRQGLPERFLSTPSARRATGEDSSTPPRRIISIHALREEGDLRHEEVSSMAKAFLSTPSARRATLRQRKRADRPQNFYPRPPRGGRPCSRRAAHVLPLISIHALREEGDGRSVSMTWSTFDFYPRPPRGGRLAFAASRSCPERFLSTPSARRATA